MLLPGGITLIKEPRVSWGLAFGARDVGRSVGALGTSGYNLSKKEYSHHPSGSKIMKRIVVARAAAAAVIVKLVLERLEQA